MVIARPFINQKEETLIFSPRYLNLQSGIPKIDNVGEHRIKLKPSNQQKRQKPYRMPQHLKMKWIDKLQNYRHQDSLRCLKLNTRIPSFVWLNKCSPVRLCVDYIYLKCKKIWIHYGPHLKSSSSEIYVFQISQKIIGKSD